MAKTKTIETPQVIASFERYTEFALERTPVCRFVVGVRMLHFDLTGYVPPVFADEHSRIIESADWIQAIL